MTTINNRKPLNFTLPLASRLLLFLCIAVLCYVICSVLVSVLASAKGESTAMMRILAVVQDIMIFIIPALATAMLVTRLPASFLAIDRRPKYWPTLLAVFGLLFLAPLLSVVTEWNESIVLPQSLAGVEEWMRTAEASARAQIDLLFGNNTVGSLIVTLLIVSVLPGFSEELFYRGTLQRLMSTGGLNGHVAIWLAAFIFSAMHFQFYGFFTRLMLGAYFGYVLYWTGNLWIPIIIHAMNNALFIINIYQNGAMGNAGEVTFVEVPLALVVGSTLLAVGTMWLLWKYSYKISHKNIGTDTSNL